MFLQPLLYDVNYNKRIDEKMYKAEIEANDDDRAIAETADTTGRTTEIVNELSECVGLTRDFYNTLAGYAVRPEESKDTPQIARLTSKLERATALIDGTDFNNFNPSNVAKIGNFVGELEELNGRMTDELVSPNLPEALRNILVGVDGGGGILQQVKNSLSSLTNLAQGKIMGRRQTTEVLGEGYGCCSMYDRFGFMDISQYQPTQYLFVG
jgi:hypothetical protein